MREETYVEAARSVGVSNVRMLRKHIFPNAVTPLLVQIALSFGYALLAEAGPQLPRLRCAAADAELGHDAPGRVQRDARKTWPVIPPGIALALTVLAINLVADGLRDALGREAYAVKMTE